MTEECSPGALQELSGEKEASWEGKSGCCAGEKLGQKMALALISGEDREFCFVC